MVVGARFEPELATMRPVRASIGLDRRCRRRDVVRSICLRPRRSSTWRSRYDLRGQPQPRRFTLSEQVDGSSGFDVMCSDALLEGCSDGFERRLGCSMDWAVRCATSSAVTRVDDAEAVTFRIRKDDEVWIGRVVPHHASGAEPDQPLDLIGLFVGIVDDEVDV